MKLIVDTDAHTLTREDGGGTQTMPLDSPEAFDALSSEWIKVGWYQKYSYSFTWMGRPIIQLPEDMIRIQEIIYAVKPDVIIETGVAHGGSLIFYAGLCKAMEKGRVVGVDIEIRPHNRAAIEAHEMFPLIHLIEGSSVEESVVDQVKAQIKAGETTLILLDSCHTKDHVLKELQAYAPLVTPGSYIVATDGIMQEVAGAARTQADWTWNNPQQAALDFVRDNPDFVIEEPPFPFNESRITRRVTYWPNAFIKRVR